MGRLLQAREEFVLLSIIMYPRLQRTIESLLPNVRLLSEERRARLERLVAFVREARAAGRPARLNFICTHNSRRSHLGQLWAQTAAAFFEVTGIETFSGGTEATAFNPRAVAAIERAGFSVRNPGGDNPRYEVFFAAEAEPQICRSKAYDDEANPKGSFAAVMTCTDADQKCPIVVGATLRSSLPYDDPKSADDTVEEAQRYDERSAEIATEMLYVFSRVAELDAARPLTELER